MSILWSKELETGNLLIDSEHKELISRINALMDACKLGKGRSQVEACADFLMNYTKSHFAHEEELQKQCFFPDYEAHKNWHAEFTKKAIATIKKVKTDGPTIATVGEINTTAGILLVHIKSMDVALAKYISSKA